MRISAQSGVKIDIDQAKIDNVITSSIMGLLQSFNMVIKTIGWEETIPDHNLGWFHVFSFEMVWIYECNQRQTIQKYIFFGHLKYQAHD